MTETLKQTAQRLLDEGRIDFERGTFYFIPPSVSIEANYDPDLFCIAPSTRIENLLESGTADELNEAYAALAVLDGSIVLDSPVDDGWRDVSEHEPPTDDSILACRQAGGAQWILNYNTVKRTWMIAGTNQSVVFTHWKPLHQPPKEAQ
jgi:hypothetical protein